MGTHGWDEGKKKAEEASSGGLFLKLENDKDKALIVWCGNPYSREVFWTGTGYVDAETDEGRVFADNNPGKKAAFRATMNAFVLDEKNGDDEFVIDLAKARMAIFENGVRWFNDLVKLRNKFGLGIWTVELQRNGKAGDSKTTYSMLPDTKMEELEGVGDAVEAGTLNDLENPFDNDDDSDSDTGSTGTGKKKAAAKTKGAKGAGKKTKASSKSNGVIAEDDATALITELKQLDREVLDQFMVDFKIKRVKELKSGELENALAWVAEKKEPGEEVDPFA